MLKNKDVVSIKDLSAAEIEEIFSLTEKIKSNTGQYTKTLSGKSLGLIFQKPSNRTRVSFEVGMAQLGGYAIYLGPEELKLGVREATKDIACVLSRYLNGIVARTFYHNDILELAKYATIPVINGLSDLTHPCQGLSDLYTINEKFRGFKGIKLAYIGDGNNVLHSLLYGAGKIGLDLAISTPKDYKPNKTVLGEAIKFSKATGAKILLTDNPKEAVKDADIVYTDVWTSMGQEKEHKKRLAAFKGFQVNKKLLSAAKTKCLIMHCLPAHRGEEITDDVIDSRNSIVYEQAENRLHVQKAILLLLLGEKIK